MEQAGVRIWIQPKGRPPSRRTAGPNEDTLLELSWDWRSCDGVKELRDLVEACAPAVLCIVDTQIAKYRVEGLAGSLGFVGRFGVDSRGRSGGLCLFWRNNVVLDIKTYSQWRAPMCRILWESAEQTHKGSLKWAGPVMHCIGKSKKPKLKRASLCTESNTVPQVEAPVTFANRPHKLG